MPRLAHVDEWTGRDASLSEVENELAALREGSIHDPRTPDLRTSVMTHIAWVPEEWLGQAVETLGGLAERHPSRTILLVPAPQDEDRLDAEVSLRCYPLPGQDRHVCSEVVQLRLGGRRMQAPASIVEPLLISDLPVFLRWRGQPPFGGSEFEQLVRVVDRLVVDSSEWPDLPESYESFAEVFDRVAASDIAWARTLEWRRGLAARWPGISTARSLGVRGPLADGLLLAGWLRSRLDVDIDLAHDPAETVEAIAIDGDPVEPPRSETRTPSDLLSEELDRFGRDAIFEQAVRAARN